MGYNSFIFPLKSSSFIPIPFPFWKRYNSFIFPLKSSSFIPMATRCSRSRSRRPSLKMKINNVFLLLPVEIAADIFSRLPVDSVSQCKLVCKTWRNLIAAEHHHSSIVDKHKGGFLLRLCNNHELGFYYGGYDDKVTYFNLTKKTIFNHRYPFGDARNWFIVGSCNGLICLSSSWSADGDDMYVCNPYTGEYAKLPNPDNPRELDHHSGSKAYGFGYHPITKEYKVIRIYYCRSTVGHVQVYTLGSGSSSTASAWRSIGETEHKLYKSTIWGKASKNNSWGILLNGVLYWLTNDDKLIISFDLADEEFRNIPSPPEHSYFTVLVVLSGCLCVSNEVLGSMQIWVMNKEDHSWIKKLSISWNHKWIFNYPLAHLENGKLLLHHDFYKIISYDSETEHFVKLKKMDKSRFDIIPYMKSSVSLKALGEKGAIQVKAEV